MEKKTFYISGPMTGIDNNNAQEFNNAACILTELGHDYVNPFDFDLSDPIPVLDKYDKGYFDNLRRDIAALTKCDALLMLKGWEVSYGARAEFVVAKELQLPVFRLAKQPDESYGLVPVQSIFVLRMDHLLPSVYWK